MCFIQTFKEYFCLSQNAFWTKPLILYNLATLIYWNTTLHEK